MNRKFFNFMKLIYSKAPPNGFVRRTIVQFYLIMLSIFNTLLHMLPFYFWKRTLCCIFGIRIGKKVSLCTGVRFLALGNCLIGDRSVINRDCLLDNRARLSIGADVSIATGVKIFTQGHDIEDANFSITRSEVVIADHVCVFANVLIMPGTRLGAGCVIFPGSVVTKSVES